MKPSRKPKQSLEIPENPNEAFFNLVDSYRKELGVTLEQIIRASNISPRFLRGKSNRTCTTKEYEELKDLEEALTNIARAQSILSQFEENRINEIAEEIGMSSKELRQIQEGHPISEKELKQLEIYSSSSEKTSHSEKGSNTSKKTKKKKSSNIKPSQSPKQSEKITEALQKECHQLIKEYYSLAGGNMAKLSKLIGWHLQKLKRAHKHYTSVKIDREELERIKKYKPFLEKIHQNKSSAEALIRNLNSISIDNRFISAIAEIKLGIINKIGAPNTGYWVSDEELEKLKIVKEELNRKSRSTKPNQTMGSPEKINEAFFNLVDSYRKELGVTLEQISRASGVSPYFLKGKSNRACTTARYEQLRDAEELLTNIARAQSILSQFEENRINEIAKEIGMSSKELRQIQEGHPTSERVLKRLGVYSSRSKKTSHSEKRNNTTKKTKKKKGK